MDLADPIKTYRGTLDEVFSHRTEIPEGALIELRVFNPNAFASPVADEAVEYEDSALAKFGHLFGTVTGNELPTDISARDEYYLRETGFGATTNLRTLDK